MSDLMELPNIGRKLAGLLSRAGIASPGDLRKIGSREAFLRLMVIDPSA